MFHFSVMQVPVHTPFCGSHRLTKTPIFTGSAQWRTHKTHPSSPVQPRGAPTRRQSSKHTHQTSNSRGHVSEFGIWTSNDPHRFSPGAHPPAVSPTSTPANLAVAADTPRTWGIWTFNGVDSFSIDTHSSYIQARLSHSHIKR